jgi:NAD(P)-dependent dehydrogenase (short-subunit alcohol dehydrogenase family)
MVLNHKGKIALITGANKGIGFEVARQLGAQGVTVFLGARNPYLGKIAEEKLKADGADAYFIELDVRKPEIITRGSTSSSITLVCTGLATVRPASSTLMPYARPSMLISSEFWQLHKRCCLWCGNLHRAGL